MDTISKDKRSWNMSRIRSKNTKPEVAVRSMLHRLGIRFRLHRSDLPGKPDIVMTKRKTVVFVHGCFWHRHPGCKYAYEPKSRTSFWQAKFQQNVARHQQVEAELERLGWRTVVVWECETSRPDELKCLLIARLGIHHLPAE